MTGNVENAIGTLECMSFDYVSYGILEHLMRATKTGERPKMQFKRWKFLVTHWVGLYSHSKGIGGEEINSVIDKFCYLQV